METFQLIFMVVGIIIIMLKTPLPYTLRTFLFNNSFVQDESGNIRSFSFLDLKDFNNFKYLKQIVFSKIHFAIECQYCLSFWSSIILWLLGFQPIENIVLQGLFGVGIGTFVYRFMEKNL